VFSLLSFVCRAAFFKFITLPNGKTGLILYLYFMRNLVVWIFIWGATMPLLAQMGRGDAPPLEGWRKSSTQRESLLPVPLDSLLEASIQEESQGVPFRFGWATLVSENALWNFLPETIGGYRFRYRLFHGPQALGLGINFSAFYLVDGAVAWISNGKQTLGGFTSAHVSDPHHFSTIALPGDSLWVLVMEPMSVFGKSDIRPSSVVQVFQPGFWDKSFGASGACNQDIVCPPGQGWEDIAKSVVMVITSNNQRKCSGTLINNTSENGEPYVLTARHCNTAANSLFAFNYTRTECGGAEGALDQVVQGCQILVNSSSSDVTLARLNQAPPVSWAAFWAGWDKSGLIPETTTTVHHPRGDVMKITHDLDPPVISGYLPMPDTGLAYWKVLDWDLGTTEGGSSGAALFNPQRQIIGQLRGGLASCANNLQDYYGRLSVSWDGAGPGNRLSEWLDPLQSGVDTLSGKFLNVPTFQNDVAITGIDGLDPLNCNQPSPILRFTNHGSAQIQQLQLTLKINGAPRATLGLTPQLEFMESATLSLGDIMPELAGDYILEVEVLSVNQQPDAYSFNNTFSRSFSVINGHPYTLQVLSDAYPEETGWEIRQSDGTLLFAQPALGDPESLTEKSLCLPTGCYQFIALDASSDGICCDYGEGWFLMIDGEGDTLFVGGAFNDRVAYDFCAPDYAQIDGQVRIFPNPSSDFFYIHFPEIQDLMEAEITIANVQGQIMVRQRPEHRTWMRVETQTWAPGVYAIDMQMPNGKHRFGKWIKWP
jgi:lysyl endopeptidase